jgi:hypothetical protein
MLPVTPGIFCLVIESSCRLGLDLQYLVSPAARNSKTAAKFSLEYVKELITVFKRFTMVE